MMVEPVWAASGKKLLVKILQKQKMWSFPTTHDTYLWNQVLSYRKCWLGRARISKVFLQYTGIVVNNKNR